MVSADWEHAPLSIAATTTVPLVYDFWGFSERYYRLTYPAPGSPSWRRGSASWSRPTSRSPNLPNGARPRGVHPPQLHVAASGRPRPADLDAEPERGGLARDGPAARPASGRGRAHHRQRVPHPRACLHRLLPAGRRPAGVVRGIRRLGGRMHQKRDFDSLLDYRERSPRPSVRPSDRRASRAFVRRSRSHDRRPRQPSARRSTASGSTCPNGPSSSTERSQRSFTAELPGHMPRHPEPRGARRSASSAVAREERPRTIGRMRAPQRRPATPVPRGPRPAVGGGAPGRLSPGHAGRSLPTALLQAARAARQWVKNLLVFAAPCAAGGIFHLAVFGRCAAAFGIFVLASASTYLVNDAMDKEADRLHPVKRLRPIAAGDLSVRTAWAAAAVMLACAIVGASLLSGAELTSVVGAYVIISLAYSLGLKRVPVIEMACVGSGFVLRAVAGGAAAHVPLSPWFLLVTSFGALFIVGGKRSSEHNGAGRRQGRPPCCSRRVSGELPTRRAGDVGVCRRDDLLPLGLRPLQPPGCASSGRSPHLVRAVDRPLRARRAECGTGRRARARGEPEELALKDRALQVLALVWVLLLLIGIYS